MQKIGGSCVVCGVVYFSVVAVYVPHAFRSAVYCKLWVPYAAGAVLEHVNTSLVTTLSMNLDNELDETMFVSSFSVFL